MMRRGEERGVTVQIGAVLLLAILFTALALYQVNAVPAENEVVEINHNDRVYDEMQVLRNGIQNTGWSDEARSSSVTLGTQYPTRTFLLNPPDPSGSLETTGTETITIENVDPVDPSAYDGDPTNLTGDHETTTFAYEPGYNEYDNAPTTRIEHGFVFNEFEDAAVTLADQPMINGNRIDLVLVDGELAERSTGAVSVDTRVLSGPSETVAVTGALRLTIPTASPSTWNETLSDAYGDNIAETTVDESAGTLTVEFEDGEYDLRIARVGVGSHASADNTFDIETDDGTGEDDEVVNPYGVTWDEDAVTVSPGETVSLTARIDDGIERPLADFAYSDPHGLIVDGSFSPDDTPFSGGTATVSFEISETATAGEATVFASTGGGLAKATVTVEPDDSDGGDGGDGGESDPPVTPAWASNVAANGDDEQQTFAFSPDGDLDAGETVTVDLSDPQDSGSGGGQPLIIDYPSGDSEDGTITIGQGSGSAVLDQDGRRNAELQYTAGDGGDIGGSEIQITVTGIETGDVGGTEYDAVFELASGTQATATFGVADGEGDQTVSGTVDEHVYSTGSLTVSQDAVVNGNAGADGSVSLEYQSEVKGGITGGEAVTTGQESVVGEDIDARSDVSLGYDSAVKGQVTSGGSVEVGEQSVVDESVDAAGDVTLAEPSEVKGTITSGGAITLEQESVAGNAVDAAGDVSLGYDSTVKGQVSSGGSVEVGEQSVVDEGIDAAGDVSLGYGATVKETVTSEATVTLADQATVDDDVDANRVELGYESEIKGDVTVASAADIECGSESTINGQSCGDYVQEHY